MQGRAITFLERMNLRRSTLRKQLETPELQSIHPILVGEQKAVEMVIDEFESETDNNRNEIPLSDSDDEKNE
ncbi:hypothetical protein D8M05_10455 [Oceanobacillus bengalensis]|uniref:Uncharacterized protein n=1 Tax=Oceanobacillus bengalensis TaxID=1435466 RepID=A0A494YYV6_9BACI|nr:hypothetical protein D8M05_10455 [Oceanobacillus bengalensis]